MKKVLIRVDASPEIGLGHAVRCIALANILKNNFSICFSSIHIPITLINEIESAGFTFNKINNENDFYESINKNDIVVIDHYGIDSSWQRKIKSKTCKLVCIDDIHDKFFYADLIINHAPGISANNYLTQAQTMFALGTEYALLRPAFLKLSDNKRKINNLNTVFVCFGGSDYYNLSERTINILLNKKYFQTIILVAGVNFGCTETLKETIENSPEIKFYQDIKEDEMAELILQSEVAIVPSSGISLEALSLGCIVISGMYVENQKHMYTQFKHQNLIINSGSFQEHEIIHALEMLFDKKENLNPVNLNLQPGKTLNLFTLLSLCNEVALKKADESDLDATYKWAVDPKIRSNSFSTHVISKQEHSNWFLKKIEDKNCLYLIASKDNDEIGSIRFDCVNGKAKISYLVDTAYQGQGFGLILLHMGIEYLGKHKLMNEINEIFGQVFFNNIPSVKAFERLGFKKQINEDHFLFHKKINKI